MQDLENNNWVILDPLGNIYEIYANLTVMTTLLNFSYFKVTQVELSLRGIFVKGSFMLVTIFLDIFENLIRKNFIYPFSPKHPKIIEIKRHILKLFSHFFVVLHKVFMKAGR